MRNLPGNYGVQIAYRCLYLFHVGEYRIARIGDSGECPGYVPLYLFTDYRFVFRYRNGADVRQFTDRPDAFGLQIGAGLVCLPD